MKQERITCEIDVVLAFTLFPLLTYPPRPKISVAIAFSRELEYIFLKNRSTRGLSCKSIHSLSFGVRKKNTDLVQLQKGIGKFLEDSQF